jgi:hypothetical protein
VLPVPAVLIYSAPFVMSVINDPVAEVKLLFGSPVPINISIVPNVLVNLSTSVEVAAPVDTLKLVTARLVEVALVIVALVEVKFVITAVMAFRIFVAKLPVTVRLLAVVEASVDEPEIIKLVANSCDKAPMFATKFVRVVLPRVDEPTVKKLAATSIPVFVDDPVLIVRTLAF